MIGKTIQHQTEGDGIIIRVYRQELLIRFHSGLRYFQLCQINWHKK